MGGIQYGLQFIGEVSEGVKIGIGQVAARDHAHHLILLHYREPPDPSLDKIPHRFIWLAGNHAGGHDLIDRGVGITVSGSTR